MPDDDDYYVVEEVNKDGICVIANNQTEGNTGGSKTVTASGQEEPQNIPKNVLLVSRKRSAGSEPPENQSRNKVSSIIDCTVSAIQLKDLLPNKRTPGICDEVGKQPLAVPKKNVAKVSAPRFIEVDVVEESEG